LSLSDQGFKHASNKRRLKVHIESEVDIFRYLGLPYKEPCQRNCFDVAHVEEELEERDERTGQRVPVRDDDEEEEEGGA
jgi:hypothetical protein